MEKKATPLKRRMESNEAKRRIGEGGGVAAFYSSFWGFSREMDDRGLPRFGLAMISSFYESWGTITVKEQELNMYMEVLF